MKRIITVGNRYVPEDAAGPRVCDRLRAQALPSDVEVIDGGLAGLDLLGFVEGAERVVFVDRSVGASPQAVFAAPALELELGDSAGYDHGAGLGYLLRMLPKLLDGPQPEVLLVGVEDEPSAPVVEQAATLALQVAVEGLAARGAP